MGRRLSVGGGHVWGGTFVWGGRAIGLCEGEARRWQSCVGRTSRVNQLGRLTATPHRTTLHL